MAEVFTKWDAANDLRNDEDVRLYLRACADEDPGDGSLTRAALGDVARARGIPDCFAPGGVREGATPSPQGSALRRIAGVVDGVS